MKKKKSTPPKHPKVGIWIKSSDNWTAPIRVISFCKVSNEITAVCQFEKKNKYKGGSSRQWEDDSTLIPLTKLRADGYKWKHHIQTIEACHFDEDKNELKGRCKRLAQKINDYAKILEHDTDGDFGSLLALMCYKLRRMAKSIGKANIVEKAPRIAKQMKRCARLLDKVHEENYNEDAQKVLTALYGETLYFTGEKLPDLGGVPWISWRRGQDFENTADIDRRMRASYDEQYRLQMRDLRKALNLMYRNILYWWD